MGNILGSKSREAEYCGQLLKPFHLGGLCPAQEPGIGGATKDGLCFGAVNKQFYSRGRAPCGTPGTNITVQVDEISVAEEMVGLLLLFNFY